MSRKLRRVVGIKPEFVERLAKQRIVTCTVRTPYRLDVNSKCLFWPGQYFRFILIRIQYTGKFQDFLSRNHLELLKVTRGSYADVQLMRKAVSKAIAPKPTNVRCFPRISGRFSPCQTWLVHAWALHESIYPLLSLILRCRESLPGSNPPLVTELFRNSGNSLAVSRVLFLFVHSSNALFKSR